jgi:simple sugar transport system ATP-binding protein
VANDDISLGIKKGEIFAFLGENGAGKSTLMSILFGMYQSDEGQLFIRGKEVHLANSHDAAALNIGMVHQHFHLVQNYTIAENIILGEEPLKRVLGFIPWLDIKGAEKRIARLSKDYGLEVDPHLRIDQAGVSTQQRTEILKMLYRNSEILIFDEPTAVLTPQEIEYLLKILVNLREKGKTVILISHKLEEIKQVADRCAILRRGKLISVMDVASTSTQEMANLMVGREVSFTREKKAPHYGDTVLEVKDLHVRDEHHVERVKGVSFSIRAGEIFAIAGVSGNGQGEIADSIAGLVKPYSGSISLGGKDILHESIRRRSEAGVLYIPEDRQKYGLILDFNLANNLCIKNYYKEPLSRRGVLNQKAIGDYAAGLIKQYDIRSGQGLRTVVRSMSGGNQQKAIVGREITLSDVREREGMGHSLIIFVQPTRGLDVGATEVIQNQIIAERDKGNAILLISLELDEVMNLADTIGVLFSGQLLKISPASELSTREVGQYMMGVAGEKNG